MTDVSTIVEALRRQALNALEELFVEIHNMMIEPYEPMFLTLEEISAVGASTPIGPGATCLAAQVEHTAFYIDVLLAGTEGADWEGSWSITSVSDAEWTALKARLRTSYDAMYRTIAERAADAWDEDFIELVLSLIGHNGFHLGQIREGMAVLRASNL